MSAVEIFDLFSETYQNDGVFLDHCQMPFISSKASDVIYNRHQQAEMEDRSVLFKKLAELLKIDIDLEGAAEALPVEAHKYVPSVAHDFWHILDYQLGKDGYLSEMPEILLSMKHEMAMSKIKDTFRYISRSSEEFELYFKKSIERTTQKLLDDLSYTVNVYQKKRPEITLLKEKIVKIIDIIKGKKVLTEEFKSSTKERVQTQYYRFRYLKKNKKVYNRIENNIRNLMHLQTIVTNIDFYHKKDKGNGKLTEFYKKSIDADKMNWPRYWCSNKEITARGFEYYISNFCGKSPDNPFLSRHNGILYYALYPSCNTQILRDYSQFFNILRKRGM